MLEFIVLLIASLVVISVGALDIYLAIDAFRSKRYFWFGFECMQALWMAIGLAKLMFIY